VDHQDLPPELDQGGVPFETSRRPAALRNRLERKRAKPPSPAVIGIIILACCSAALAAVRYFSDLYSVLASLVVGG
jgi:hypothetical protein